MRENFPHKNPGDILSAERVNVSGGVEGRFGRMVSGPNLSTFHHHSHVSISGPAPWKQYIFRVTSDTVLDDDGNQIDGVYEGLIRWYDAGATAWKPDDDATDAVLNEEDKWNLDTGGLGISLAVDDLVVAYWDAQRGMFIPIIPSVPIRRFRLLEDLYNLGSANALILADDPECPDVSVGT